MEVYNHRRRFNQTTTKTSPKHQGIGCYRAPAAMGLDAAAAVALQGQDDQAFFLGFCVFSDPDKNLAQLN